MGKEDFLNVQPKSAGKFDAIWDQYQKKIGEKDEMEKKSVEMIPIAGFVVKGTLRWIDDPKKAKKKKKKQKKKEEDQSIAVYLNICSSFLVGEPKTEHNPNPVPGDPSTAMRLRIPVACGPAVPMPDEDQKSPCVSYDCVFNTVVVEQAKTDADYRSFVSDLAAQNVVVKESKHTPIEITGPFTMLKKTPYKAAPGTDGKPLPQRIRKSGAQSRIQEVSSNAAGAIGGGKPKKAPAKKPVRASRKKKAREVIDLTDMAGDPAPSSTKPKAKARKKITIMEGVAPKHAVFAESSDGKLRRLEGKVDGTGVKRINVAMWLDQCKSGVDKISVEMVGDSSVELRDQAEHYSLDVELPVPCAAAGNARWHPEKRVLVASFTPLRQASE